MIAQDHPAIGPIGITAGITTGMTIGVEERASIVT